MQERGPPVDQSEQSQVVKLDFDSESLGSSPIKPTPVSTELPADGSEGPCCAADEDELPVASTVVKELKEIAPPLEMVDLAPAEQAEEADPARPSLFNPPARADLFSPPAPRQFPQVATGATGMTSASTLRARLMRRNEEEDEEDDDGESTPMGKVLEGARVYRRPESKPVSAPKMPPMHGGVSPTYDKCPSSGKWTRFGNATLFADPN